MINAVIATEDRSFWTNDGIDLGAVFRAFLANVTSGRIEQGGSTITQQLVKNRILTSKRDVNRKIKEIEDALRLNEKFSKDKILVEYLNTVYLGSNSYGIKAAAARFFLVCDNGCPFGPRGKTLNELTVGETALLAGLISNPEGNSPFTHPDRAIRRRADVLRGEVNEGYITQAQADAANNEPLPTVPPPAEPVVGPTSSPPRCRTACSTTPALGNTEKERLRQALQGWAEDLHHVRPQPAADGDRRDHRTRKPQKGDDWASSLVSIDPSTGAVKAMVSGQRLRRQPDQHRHLAGRSPDRLHVQGDHPRHRIVQRLLAQRQRRRLEPLLRARLRRTGGERRTRRRLQRHLGVHRWFDQLRVRPHRDERRRGQGHRHGPQDGHHQAEPPALSSVSPWGSSSRTPRPWPTVMATIADLGVHHTPYVVQKVVGADGTVLFDQSNNPGDQVLDPQVAACEQNVLRGVVTGGTGTKANVDGQDDLRQDRYDRRSRRRLVHRRDAAARHRGLVRELAEPGARRRVRWRLVGAGVRRVHEPGPGRSARAAAARPRSRVRPARGRRSTPRRPRRRAPAQQHGARAAAAADGAAATHHPGTDDARADCAAGDGAAGHRAADPHPREHRPVSEELEQLLALQERDGALDRLLHRHQTLPEREALARMEADTAALDGRIATMRTERDVIARDEQHLDDEARALAEKATEVEAKMLKVVTIVNFFIYTNIIKLF